MQKAVFISPLTRQGNGLARSDRRGGDDAFGTQFSRGAQRDDYHRAGCKPVINNYDSLVAPIERRQVRTIGVLAALQFTLLSDKSVKGGRAEKWEFRGQVKSRFLTARVSLIPAALGSANL